MTEEKRFEDYGADGYSTSPSLIEALKAGDNTAWEKISDIWGHTLLKYCRKRGIGNSQDITQEVLLRMFKSFNTFDESKAGRSLRRWIYTITSNAVIDHFNREQKNFAAPGGTDNLKFVSDKASATVRTADDNDEAAFAEIYENQIIKFLMKSAGEATTKAFQKYYYYQTSIKELADELAVEEGTLKTRFSRLRARVRQEFDSKM